jgi:hypothetical protein
MDGRCESAEEARAGAGTCLPKQRSWTSARPNPWMAAVDYPKQRTPLRRAPVEAAIKDERTPKRHGWPL